ncbi:hypothetical protein ACSBR1_010672 [Camellia fascicularis]
MAGAVAPPPTPAPTPTTTLPENHPIGHPLFTRIRLATKSDIPHIHKLITSPPSSDSATTALPPSPPYPPPSSPKTPTPPLLSTHSPSSSLNSPPPPPPSSPPTPPPFSSPHLQIPQFRPRHHRPRIPSLQIFRNRLHRCWVCALLPKLLNILRQTRVLYRRPVREGLL